MEPIQIPVDIPNTSAWICIDNTYIRGILIKLEENKIRIVIGLLSKNAKSFDETMIELENELFEKSANINCNCLNFIMKKNKIINNVIYGKISQLDGQTILQNNPYINKNKSLQTSFNKLLSYTKSNKYCIDEWIELISTHLTNNTNNLLIKYLKYMSNFVIIELAKKRNEKSDLYFETIKIMYHFYIQNNYWCLTALDVKNGEFNTNNYFVGGESNVSFDYGRDGAMELSNILPDKIPQYIKNTIGYYVHGEHQGHWHYLRQLFNEHLITNKV